MKYLFCAAVIACTATMGSAASIDVLWTSGSASYNSDMAALGAGGSDDASSYDPDGDGSLSWNITFWGAGDPLPEFSDYDVLVSGSEGSGFGTGIDHAGTVLSAKSEITAARGSRTFLSGQDADFHYRNGPGAVDDGPRGFLINAVNWAASGTGLGIVSLPDGFSGSGSRWWLDSESFLRDELLGYTQYFQDNSVYLGDGQEGFPVNEGLTTGGLSNWGVSSHAGFDAGIPGYTTINFEGPSSSGRAITIVTAGREDGGTGGGDEDDVDVIPLPGTAWLMLAGLGGLGALRRRKS